MTLKRQGLAYLPDLPAERSTTRVFRRFRAGDRLLRLPEDGHGPGQDRLASVRRDDRRPGRRSRQRTPAVHRRRRPLPSRALRAGRRSDADGQRQLPVRDDDRRPTSSSTPCRATRPCSSRPEARAMASSSGRSSGASSWTASRAPARRAAGCRRWPGATPWKRPPPRRPSDGRDREIRSAGGRSSTSAPRRASPSERGGPLYVDDAAGLVDDHAVLALGVGRGQLLLADVVEDARRLAPRAGRPSRRRPPRGARTRSPLWTVSRVFVGSSTAAPSGSRMFVEGVPSRPPARPYGQNRRRSVRSWNVASSASNSVLADEREAAAELPGAARVRDVAVLADAERLLGLDDLDRVVREVDDRAAAAVDAVPVGTAAPAAVQELDEHERPAAPRRSRRS